jgi:hypothetical protein
VSSQRFWRAAAIQLVVVAIPFAILAATLSHRFFVDYGFAVGPVLWLVCSLVTGRILGLPLQFSVFCAAASGVAAVLVLLVFGHEVGIVAGIGVFAACASGYGGPAVEPPPEAGERERLSAQSSIP